MLLADLFKMVLATLPAAGAAWIIGQQGAWMDGPTVANGLVLAGAGITGGALYGLAAMVLKISAVDSLKTRISKRLKKRG